MLEKPKLIWSNGQVREWGQATVHVTSETATRGINVFEGLRAYWDDARSRHLIVAIEQHMRRLAQSARLIHLPADRLVDEVRDGIDALLAALDHRGDLYIRASVYLDDGRYTADPSGMRLGAFVAAYPVDRAPLAPVTLATSTWHRIADGALPTASKVGAAYAAFRLARLDASARGADEPILLNERGTVAETAGASIFVIRRGVACTPPLSDGILDSITRRIVSRILPETAGVPVVEQSLSRSDLATADEVFICGTLDEIRPVSAVDGIARPAPGPVTEALFRDYRAMCEGTRPPLDPEWLHEVPVPRT